MTFKLISKIGIVSIILLYFTACNNSVVKNSEFINYLKFSPEVNDSIKKSIITLKNQQRNNSSFFLLLQYSDDSTFSITVSHTNEKAVYVQKMINNSNKMCKIDTIGELPVLGYHDLTFVEKTKITTDDVMVFRGDYTVVFDAGGKIINSHFIQ